MRVRVCYTVEASDDWRRALAHDVGEHGKLASRKRVREQAELSGESENDDIMYAWQNCDEGCQP